MDAQITRYRVFVNPVSGEQLKIPLFTMPKKVLTPLEALLCDNVKRLIDMRFDGKPSRVHEKNKAIRLQTIQDMYNRVGGCSLPMLERIAKTIGIDLYQLFIRDLDAKEPQVAVTAAQMRAIKQLREVG